MYLLLHDLGKKRNEAKKKKTRGTGVWVEMPNVVEVDMRNEE